MIWASEPPPVYGQRRAVRRFAWLPVRESENKKYGHRVVWLQHYLIHEVYEWGWRSWRREVT